jgi:hypothetical protein
LVPLRRPMWKHSNWTRSPGSLASRCRGTGRSAIRAGAKQHSRQEALPPGVEAVAPQDLQHAVGGDRLRTPLRQLQPRRYTCRHNQIDALRPVPVRPDRSPNPWEIARLLYWNGSVH